MATSIPLINPSGAGTVLPVTNSPTPLISNGIGLSTQLIIWGMIGFILVELLSILCLLRYCCRARYIRKRKFKEKEIILADSGNISETKPQYFFGRKSTIMTTATQQDSQKLQQQYAIEERQSLSSMRPILTETGPISDNFVCHQETIMIDEISAGSRTMTPPPPPIYANPPGRSTLNEPSMHHPEPIDKKSRINVEQQYNAAISANENRMRQELSSEDIYTLRFSTSVALPLQHSMNLERQTNEQFDDPPISNQLNSYLYNGCLNRPAFEIISHADVRPATPIQFEQVKDLNPSSSSTFDQNYNSRHQFCNKDPNHASQTEFLSFSDEKCFAEMGEKVEWQTAHELRTTNWNRLKEITNPEKATSSQYYDFAQNEILYEQVAPENSHSAAHRQIDAFDASILDDLKHNAHDFDAQNIRRRSISPNKQNGINHPVSMSSFLDQNNFDDDSKMEENIIFKSLPSPPVQFQQQKSQEALSTLTEESSRKSSLKFIQTQASRRESIEALRAYNEIDLNNDSISLHTLHQLTPKDNQLDDYDFENLLDDESQNNQDQYQKSSSLNKSNNLAGLY